MKVIFLFIVILTISINSFSQFVENGAGSMINTVDFGQQYLDTVYRYEKFNNTDYKIRYVYNSDYCTIPSTNPPGPSHYDATITVYRKVALMDHYIENYYQVGDEIQGKYVKEGCFEDIPENYIKTALETQKSKHRKHELGLIFSTYPPIYSCKFCGKEYSVYNHCKSMKEYGEIVKKYGDDAADSFFLAKWNEQDTSCLSGEEASRKSDNVWTRRYNDSILLVDKWFKTIYFTNAIKSKK